MKLSVLRVRKHTSKQTYHPQAAVQRSHNNATVEHADTDTSLTADTPPGRRRLPTPARRA
jgi:hypothetical protein